MSESNESEALAQGVIKIRRDTENWYRSLTPLQQRRATALAGMVYDRLSEPFKREIEGLLKATDL